MKRMKTVQDNGRLKPVSKAVSFFEDETEMVANRLSTMICRLFEKIDNAANAIVERHNLIYCFDFQNSNRTLNFLVWLLGKGLELKMVNKLKNKLIGKKFEFLAIVNIQRL